MAAAYEGKPLTFLASLFDIQMHSVYEISSISTNKVA